MVNLGALKFEHYHTSMKGITLTNNGRVLQVNKYDHKETAMAELAIYPDLSVRQIFFSLTKLDPMDPLSLMEFCRDQVSKIFHV